VNDRQGDADHQDRCALRAARQQARQQRHGSRDERQVEEQVRAVEVQPLDQRERRRRQATDEAARREVAVGRVHERVFHEHAQYTSSLESGHVAEDPEETLPRL
jgi:hypothetical protein